VKPNVCPTIQDPLHPCIISPVQSTGSYLFHSYY